MLMNFFLTVFTMVVVRDLEELEKLIAKEIVGENEKWKYQTIHTAHLLNSTAEVSYVGKW